MVAPEEQITDYVTHITGLTQESFLNAPSYSIINEKVIKLIQNRIVVGHTVQCDLEKFTSSEKINVTFIDVSEFPEYMRDSFRKSKLKDLSSIHLNAKIQEGVHSSIIDA